MSGLFSYDSGSSGSDSPLAKPPKAAAAAVASSSLVDYSEEEDGSSSAEDEGAPIKKQATEGARAPAGFASSVLPPASLVAAAAAATAAHEDAPLPPAGTPAAAPALLCDPGVQEDVCALLALHGPGFVAAIRSKKEFNNPYTLEQVSQFIGVDALGSHFPVRAFGAEDWYEALAARSAAGLKRAPSLASTDADARQSTTFVP